MSSTRHKHWTPVPPLDPILSTRDGSITVLPIASVGLTTPVHPLDLSKADLSLPTVRPPLSLPPIRRYTRRIGGAARRPLFLYDVSPGVYRVVWVIVLVLHAACALYLGMMAASQFYLLGTSLLPYLTLYGITVGAFYLPPIGVGYFVVCGLHAFSFATILFHSLRSQRNAFTSTQVMPRTVTTPIIRIRRASLTALSSVEFRTQSMLLRLPSPFVRACFHLWRALTKLYEATAIQNECYDAIYVSRMILQSLVHMHQLYLASLYLPQPRITTAWVALFVFNCWAVPLLSLVFCSNRPRTRLLCVFVNLILDVGVLVVFAGLVMYPYATTYDMTATNFPRALWYTDAWFIRTVNEFRVLAVVTPLDFVAKIAIALNVWRSLCVIPTMLKKVDNDDIVPTPQEPTGGTAQEPPPPSQKLIAVEPSSSCNVSLLGSLVLVLLGAGVLVVHVQANSWVSVPHCSLPVQAWLVSKPACSFLEYKCVTRNESGNEQELSNVFSTFEPSLVSYLSIRFCTHVEFPRELQAFRNLLGIKLYNSTLARWDDRAAVTATYHPDIRFVYFIDVDMGEFPRALLSNDFPHKLFDVEFCRTNVSTLPNELDQLWPKQTMTFTLEECPLTELPPVVVRLQPSAVSLARSGLTSVPAALFDYPELNYVVLNGNPLVALPSNVTLGSKFRWLTAQQTLLVSVPDAYAAVRVGAQGTPLCETLAGSASVNVDCTTSVEPIDMMMYPIDLEELLNGGPPRSDPSKSE